MVKKANDIVLTRLTRINIRNLDSMMVLNQIITTSKVAPDRLQDVLKIIVDEPSYHCIVYDALHLYSIGDMSKELTKMMLERCDMEHLNALVKEDEADGKKYEQILKEL